MKTAEKEELIALYLNGFSDSRNYAEWFVSGAEADNILKEYVGDELVSCGYIFYKDACLFGRNKRLAYLSALVTKDSYRGTGKIAAIIRQAFDKLYARGDWLAVLNPFHDTFYKKFGFADISFRESRCIDGGKNYQHKTISPSDYHVMSRIESIENEKFDNYLLSSPEKLTRLASNFQADGMPGELVTDECGNVFAFLFYNAKEIEYYAATDMQRFDCIERYKGLRYDRFLSQGSTFIQGRIINVLKALRAYPYDPGIDRSISLKIRDPFIADNNRVFALAVKDGHASVRVYSDACPFDEALDISVLCSYMFQGGLGIFGRSSTLLKEKY